MASAPTIGGECGLDPELTALLLGGCRITIAGRAIDTTSSRRTRGLLAYLLVHRRSPVARDALMETFWPRATPAAARNSLHVALTALRRAIRAAWPDPVLLRHDDTYSVAPQIHVRTDLDAFEDAVIAARAAERRADTDTAVTALGLAAQLYAGDFLPGDLYSDWAGPVREQLRLDALEARRGLMRILGERGDHGTAAVIARTVLAMDPADESAHLALIENFAANGQRHLALAQYQQLARTLWRDFGIGPSADTVRRGERLRDPGGTVSDRGRTTPNAGRAR